jgi:hypothetical protein
MSNLSTIKYRPTSGEQNKFDYLITNFIHYLVTALVKFIADFESAFMNAHLSSSQRVALAVVRYVHRVFFTTPCDDDTLILHANSRRGLPQCWNNYTLFIFSLISTTHLPLQPTVHSALLIPRSRDLFRFLAENAGCEPVLAMSRIVYVE